PSLERSFCAAAAAHEVFHAADCSVPSRGREMSTFISRCLIAVPGSRRPVLGFREQRVWSNRRRAAAAVGSRDRFENMAVGILEVDPAAAIPLVDLVALAETRIRPLGPGAFPNAREDLVEFGLGYQKSVMLRNDVPLDASVLFNIHIIERGVPYRYDRKVAQP